MHIPTFSFLRLACACSLLSLSQLYATSINIDQSIQDQLPQHYQLTEGYTELRLTEDLDLTGANNVSFSSDEMLLFTNQAYSFSLKNGAIKASFIELYELKSLSFSASNALEGAKGILEVVNIDPANPPEGYYANMSRISLALISETITFNNNGSASGTRPNAALWAWAELNAPMTSGSDASQAEIAISQVPRLEFSNNYWGTGAIQAYGKSVNNAIADIMISVDSAVFAHNESAGSLISARSEGLDGSSSVSMNGLTLSMTDNVSGDSMIKAHAKGETGGYASVNFRYDESLLLARNSSNGDGGVVSARLEVDPSNYGGGNAKVEFSQNRQAVIEYNTSLGNGGAVSSVTKASDGYSGERAYNANIGFAIQGTMESDFVIQHNHAEGKGGAVYVAGGTVLIEALTNDTDTIGNVIFRGNTMGNRATGDLIANSLYVEASNAYQAGIADLRAQEGNSIIFEGSVISKPYTTEEDRGPIMHINRAEIIPYSTHEPGVYKGTVLFTGQSVQSTIGPKQAWETDEHYKLRIDQSRISRIDQDTILHNGTLAVQHNAELIIKTLTVEASARYELEDGTGNFDGARLNTNFNGLIHVQGNVDLSGLADIDIRGYLGGTRSMEQSSPIWMQIDTGDLKGIIEIMNVGNLYAAGLLDDSMAFNILTLNLVDGHTPDVSELLTSADRFNLGLGITDPAENWLLTWEENYAGEDTLSLVLHKGSMIPEPTSISIALLGLAALTARRRKRLPLRYNP